MYIVAVVIAAVIMAVLVTNWYDISLWLSVVSCTYSSGCVFRIVGLPNILVLRDLGVDDVVAFIVIERVSE